MFGSSDLSKEDSEKTPWTLQTSQIAHSHRTRNPIWNKQFINEKINTVDCQGWACSTEACELIILSFGLCRWVVSFGRSSRQIRKACTCGRATEILCVTKQIVQWIVQIYNNVMCECEHFVHLVEPGCKNTKFMICLQNIEGIQVESLFFQILFGFYVQTFMFVVETNEFAPCSFCDETVSNVVPVCPARGTATNHAQPITWIHGWLAHAVIERSEGL